MHIRMIMPNTRFCLKLEFAKLGSTMKAKPLKLEADSSQGTSKRHRLKQRPASRKQGGTEASSQHIFELYEGEEENMICLPEATDAAKQPNKRSFTLLGINRNSTMTPRSAAVQKKIFLRRAETALKFYENSQGDEFEILEVLDCNGATVCHPNYNISKLWLHISFTAKSKNSDSPKLFFGELYRDEHTMEYHAVYCSTFEPNDDPGFKHGCVFCPPGQKYHPSEGFLVGRLPWFLPKMRLWGGCEQGLPPWKT